VVVVSGTVVVVVVVPLGGLPAEAGPAPKGTNATTIAKTTRRANHRRSIADSHFTLDDLTPIAFSF
jgi:hypothetical protein